MMSRQFLREITIVIAIAALLVTTFILMRSLIGSSSLESSRFYYILVTTTGLTSLAYGLATIRFLARTPVPLTISLLGFPGAGKTVYLTTLFEELQQNRDGDIRFAPYGRETIEAVNSGLNLLASGRWPPRTASGSVFTYRATASLEGFFIRRQYKIEIADYAGEHMDELNPTDPAWLHKTDYFKYVVQSDAVILALDAPKLILSDAPTRSTIQNAYVAAFQVLAEEKGATESRLLRSPVALIFLKMDALEDHSLNKYYLEECMNKLIKLCESRCRHFRVFYVSSIGQLGQDGSPPEKIYPKNVIDPLIWILKNSIPTTPWGRR
jgi:hypothetical protein